MWLFDLFRRKPRTIEVQLVEADSRERCAYQFGGFPCSMRRTKHGKFCTFHR